jgi:hypothetical protein
MDMVSPQLYMSRATCLLTHYATALASKTIRHYDIYSKCVAVDANFTHVLL